MNTPDLKTTGDLINQLKGLYSRLEGSVASSSVALSLTPGKRKWVVIHMLLAAREKNLTLEQAMDDPELLEQVLEIIDSVNIHTRVDEKLLEELTTILTEPLIVHWREEFRDHQVGFKKAFNEMYERLFCWLSMRDVPIAMLGEAPFVGGAISEESAYSILNRNEQNEIFSKLVMKSVNGYMEKNILYERGYSSHFS